MQTRFLPSVARAALVAALFAPTAFAAQLTVGPTGAYPDISAALVAANHGDVIVVQPGIYGVFHVTKAVRIVGPGPDHATVMGSHAFGIRVSGVPAGAEVVISGFKVRANGAGIAYPASIVVDSSPGTVVLHDIVVATTHAQPALHATDAARLVVSECSMLGAGGVLTMGTPPAFAVAVKAEESGLWVVGSRISGGPPPGGLGQEGNLGIEARGSTVHVWNSVVEGGNAVYGWGAYAPSGGAGIWAWQASRVVLYGGPDARIQGGNGALQWMSPSAGGGAPAVVLTASTLVREASVALVGGMDAYGVVQANALLLSGSSIATEVDESAPVLVPGASAVSLGTALALAVHGKPGAGAAVFAAVAAGPVYSTETTLLFLPADALLFVGAALLDQDGGATLGLGVPPLPALVGVVVHLQAAQIGDQGLSLSNPAFAPILP